MATSAMAMQASVHCKSSILWPRAASSASGRDTNTCRRSLRQRWIAYIGLGLRDQYIEPGLLWYNWARLLYEDAVIFPTYKPRGQKVIHKRPQHQYQFCSLLEAPSCSSMERVTDMCRWSLWREECILHWWLVAITFGLSHHACSTILTSFVKCCRI